MRSTLSVRLIILLALWGLLPAVANAQATATAQNTVTVHIPTVLRMQLTSAARSVSSDVHFTSTADGALDPQSVTVNVFANVAWTLSVKDAGGAGARLQIAPGTSGAWRTVTPAGISIASGTPTGGWTPYSFSFRPDAPLDSGFHRTLTFTLAKP